MNSSHSSKGISHWMVLGLLPVLIPAFLPSAGGAASQAQLLPLLVITSLLLCLVTLVDTNFGLSVVIFSMLLSPELEVFRVPAKAVVIRFEDFLLLAVFLTWMAKMAIFKEIALFQHSPLNRPILLYIVVCVVCTLLGMMGGTIVGPAPFFYILKYVEYFLVFFMFINNLKDKQQVQKFLTLFLATGLIVSLAALSQYGKTERLAAPFEGKNPEPASLGGYLLIMISFTLGLLSYPEWPRHRWLLWLFLSLFGTTLLLSISRGALVAVGPLYLVAILLASRRRGVLLFLLIITVVAGVLLIPPRVIAFFREAFTGTVFEVGGVQFEMGASGTERFENWHYVFQRWKSRPVIGYGVTGVGLVDNQFIRVLGETGVIGFSVFAWLLATIFRIGFFALKNGTDNLSRALGMALICANVGLMVQGFAANSFIIVRIMEPFWFLAALAFKVPRLQGSPD